MLAPCHPGDFLKTEIIEAYGLSVTKAATILKVSRTALSNLLNGHADLTPEMGLRFEAAFGVRMDTMMRMQNAYDIAEARKIAGKIRGIKRYEVPALRAS
jgi:addiction module HigA family antidote